MSDENDLAVQHQDHRIRLAETSALEQMLSRVKLKEKPAATAEGTPAAPATSPVQDQAAVAPGQMTLSDLIVGKQFEPVPDDSGPIARTMKDIGKGLFVESPRALWTGARDAVQSTIDMADDLGTWVEEAGKLPGLKIDGDGISVVSAAELKKLPRVADKMVVPGNIAKPTTVTGGALKGVAQFVTGMAMSGKALKVIGVPEMAGTAGYVRSAAQGALANFAAFDPHQQRLSNLIQKVPALQNPVTEFLASKPDDSSAEGRFKNALEGIGLGVLTDGFLKGVKMLRGAFAAKMQAQTAHAAATAVAPREMSDDIAVLLGDAPAPGTTAPAAPGATSAAVAQAPLVLTPKAPDAEKLAAAVTRTAELAPDDVAGRMVGSPDQVASSAAGRAMEPPKTFINFARIETTDDVKRVMQDLADNTAPAADAAKAGARSFEQVKLDANHTNAWNLLVNRRAGQPLADHELLAARQLWATATDKLASLAQAAADQPSEANLFAFRKMLAVHDVVQREVLGARAATARALASWKIPAGTGAERLRDVTDLLTQNGGTEISRELATRVAGLAKAGMIDEIGAVAQKTAYARGRDAVMEAWINGLLSNPTTHAANTVSNSAVMGLRIVERKVAEKISSVLGDDAAVQAGEAAAQFSGTIGGIKDAFRNAWKAARTGESGYGIGKVEMGHEAAITSEALGLSNTGWFGRGVDFLGNVVRIPGRLLTAEDEFFKTSGYRGEVHAQAVRQASLDVNAGLIDADGAGARIAQLLENPPENIRIAAVDAAQYQTFTNAPFKLAQQLQGMTAHYPGLKVIIPFIRTPANIFAFTMERTPLAPVLKSFRANIAAGGARRDLALAQMGMGTMAMMAFGDMTLSGQITGAGPADQGAKEALRREGWQPYSVRVGDRWLSYSRLDPVGSLMGMAADAAETSMHFAEHAEQADLEKVWTAAAVAAASNVVNKTYLSGLTAAIGALNDPQQSAEAWAQRLAGSAVPAVVAGAERLEDPYVREVYNMMDAIKARVPGASGGLPIRRDLWGEPIKSESGFGKPYDAFVPVMSQQPTPEPIDRELLRLGSNVTMPDKITSFDGIRIDLAAYPKAYDRYVELAGNALKNPAWGMGAKDLLNAIVTGKHPLSAVYKLKSDGPQGGKDFYLRGTINQYRELARRQLLKEFPDLSAEVAAKKAKQQELKLPVLG